MPTKKRNLEKVEAVAKASKMKSPPRLMTVQEMCHWRTEVVAAIARAANAPKNREATPRTGKPKSKTRIEFESCIAGIADKLKDAPPAPVPPLLLNMAASGEVARAPVVDDEPPELLLARLLKKVDRNYGR